MLVAKPDRVSGGMEASDSVTVDKALGGVAAEILGNGGGRPMVYYDVNLAVLWFFGSGC